ncbi:MAG: hypothetical protein P4L22_01895 [Candidatus Babeliales bacterium]|nr:hypothetical protein [Candidatus Babeliales bacterium]
MTINFTIIIQAIHFFLAYLIITRFFIKPALDIIVLQEKQDRELLRQLDLYTKKYEEKNKNKLDLWKESLIKFSFYKSDIDKTKNKIQVNWEVPKVCEPSDFLINSLKKETLSFLKDKISHVQ